MVPNRTNAWLTLSLLFAVFLWGGNNTGTKLIVTSWPPIWTGASRFFCAGLLLLIILRSTTWLGPWKSVTRQMQSRLWWRGGLSLAAYIVSFNCALLFTSPAHVALYLGAAPIWALLWEGLPERSWSSIRKYAAAILALTGLFVLFWPALKDGSGTWLGEALGLTASVLWTNYGRQCRTFAAELNGAQISAHTMWRAGVLLMPLACVELVRGGLEWRAEVVGVQLYCILFGGVAVFGIWSHALKFWPTSQVLLFNNLIPISTMLWSHYWLGEQMTSTFWLAMLLVLAGVMLAQVNWGKLMTMRLLPPE